MTPDNIHTKVDAIIDVWRQGFGKLEKRQKNGESISEQDVMNVILVAGKDIYESGLTMEAVSNSGYKKAEFERIFNQANKQNVPLTEVALGNSGNNTMVSSIQMAALGSASGTTRESIIASIEQDPGYLPPQDMVNGSNTTATVTASKETEQTPLPVIATDITKQAVKSSATILEKIAPPDTLTKGTDNSLSLSSAEETEVEKVANTQNDKIFGITEVNEKEPIPDSMKNAVVGGVSAGASGQSDEPLELIQMPVRIIEPTNRGTDIGPL